jgi:hypothetical protein
VTPEVAANIEPRGIIYICFVKVNKAMLHAKYISGRHFDLNVFLFVSFEFYVTSTQYRSYRDVPALLVEEDLTFVHYFRHERAPE